MSVEKYQPTPEEQAKMQKERTVHDALLLERGAVYVPTEGGNFRLDITGEQLEEFANKLKEIEYLSDFLGKSMTDTFSILELKKQNNNEKRDKVEAETKREIVRKQKQYGFSLSDRSREEIRREIEQRNPRYSEDWETAQEYMHPILESEQELEVSEDIKRKVQEAFNKIQSDYSNFEVNLENIDDPELREKIKSAFVSSQQNLADFYKNELRNYCCVADDARISRVGDQSHEGKIIPQEIINAFTQLRLNAWSFVGAKKPINLMEHDGFSQVRYYLAHELSKMEDDLSVGTAQRELINRLRHAPDELKREWEQAVVKEK